MRIWSRCGGGAGAAALVAGVTALAGMAPAEDRAVTFSGGHDIGRDDHGRPCVPIAAALGVPTEVFREAFGGVTPARGRGPSGDEARKNKAALMKVLAPRGVTNDRLDAVSNHHRIPPRTANSGSTPQPGPAPSSRTARWSESS